MGLRASEGRDPNADEKVDSSEEAEAARVKVENKRVREDVWMRAESV